MYERDDLQLLKAAMAEPIDKFDLSIELYSIWVPDAFELESFPRTDFDNFYLFWEAGHEMSLSRNDTGFC